MIRSNNRAKNRLIIAMFMVILLINFIHTSYGQEVKWFKVGSLQTWFREDGCEPEVGRTFLQADQQDGYRWPAQFHGADKEVDNMAAKALWIATTNYTDAAQYGGVTYPQKVVHVGPRGWDLNREFMPQVFKLIGRFEHPKVYVDGIEASELKYDDILDEIDPNLVCDRMIYNVVNTSIGITEKRKIMTWAQQNHDNYFITEYIFTNTGNVDPDEEIEKPDQTLENVYFTFQYRYSVSREGADGTGLNSPRWGINAMLGKRGEAKASDSKGSFVYAGDYEDWLNGNAAADSLRCQFSWAGRHSGASYDLIGYPDVVGQTGRLQGPQYIGVVTLHADKSATDKTDDPKQPRTSSYEQSDDPPTRPNDQFDPKRMSEEWKWIARGHRLPRHAELVGDGFPDQLEGTPGGFSNLNSYGPYTLGPGDSIRIVMAEAVNGLDRELCKSIGKDWIDENSPYTLPDGSTTTDRDQFKNAWVFTGQDSLFKSFSRARKIFTNDYQLPSTPPPPDYFEVTSGGDRITLSWSKTSESWPGFAGYKLYRAVGKYDTTYQQIFACGGGTDHPDLVNEFDDITATRGKAYYYYITSFDDGTNNPGTMGNPAGVLESSLFWTRTIEPAFLKREAGIEPYENLRIVPNPYNIRARDFQYPGEPDKLMFLNIPGECTIRIYTERGDLIKTIIHDDGSGDESWNLNTEYGQVVVSGVYIAIIEPKQGDPITKKFVVIR
ncbi:fibronectin [candidate division KSB1 bacterium]|nr:fibronectin [candidate division KSB1 bacterium]